ncbi:SHD1 domain-containing protein [Pontiellaceae bacterium B1224]|nr:SHD1 domain-containing protein [Pontiellaceae bacterium B1224]
MSKKTKNIVKGTPSGLVLSLMIHAAAFILAGVLVVFNVVNKEEKKFVPPKPVERPKMKLKKPKVKVKKDSKPRSSERIVTKVQRADMPEIYLPEMSGIGDGVGTGGGYAGFDLIPDLESLTLMGSGQTIGNDFEGTFYDLKRNRTGRSIAMSSDAAHEIMYNFLSRGWKKSVLARYYQSPQKIYSTTFMVPPVRANLAPEIFNEDTEGWAWCMHYTGELVYPEDIKFRFWGNGLQVMAVRVDGEIVLLSYFEKDTREGAEVIYGGLWQSDSAQNRKYPMGLFKCHVGDWIELKANEPVKMEVMYGIGGGGIFNAMLCVEVEGEEYPRSPYMGGPILPIFKTEPLSRDMLDVVGTALYPGFGCMTNGPVFRDFGLSSDTQAASMDTPDTPEEPEPVILDPKAYEMRVWTTVDGKEFEAEYVVRSGDQLWMKSADGRKQKVPLSIISAEDIKYIELMNPPDFQIEFSKRSWQRQETPNSTEVDQTRPIRRHDYIFGAKVKQKTMRPYDYPLTIEYFAVGEEVDGDNYVLFDRKESTFTPGPDNNLEHEFFGEEVDVMTWAMTADKPLHGNKYGGFLITITNERGEIIQYKATHDFLIENLGNLKKIPVGRHFDKMCNRVAPPRPTQLDVYAESY